MTMPPMGAAGPALSMTVEDVFHIKGRGTVVTGQLRGDGQLSVGDALVYDGRRWQVTGIEQFRSSLMTALPGSHIGVLLRDGPPAAMVRGRMVQFEAGAQAGQSGPGPQFGPFTPVTAKKKRRFR